MPAARPVPQECRELTGSLKARGVTPGLAAVVIVGENAASKVYAANKVKAGTEVGLTSTVYAFTADAPDTVVEAEIQRLNADPRVHGVLVHNTAQSALRTAGR